MSERPELAVALLGLSWPGYRSLALGYVRAYAQADRRLAGRVGFATLDLDCEQDPWWVAYRVLELDPDVVGISVSCFNARVAYEVAELLTAARPGTRIVLGGPEVGPIAEDLLRENPAITAIVRGEGEETFAELLHAILRGKDLSRVDGVTARDLDGAVRSAPDRPLIADLDAIPSPWVTGILEPLDGSSYIESYRGCPHQCGYCYEGKGYGRLRHFSRERIADEIDVVAGAPGIRSFSFIDPVFNLTPERLEWLSETLQPYVQRGVRLHTIEVDIERMDARAATLLALAGVASVETGPQTIGAEALSACRRGFDATRFAAGVAACRERNISVECDLIVGLPGDSEAEFRSGLEFVLALDPGKIQFSTLHVLPGTDLWENAERYGLIYNARPPHELVRTATMDFGSLRRAEVFGAAVTRFYSAALPRPATETATPEETR